MDSELKAYLEKRRAQIDAALGRYLPAESVEPTTVHRAMRHSMFAGGKRLRPALTLAAARACQGDELAAIPLACAVECIHTYSLMHDDLPCMDDDDFRRGQPTCHKVYGENIAVLGGDALQPLAFELVAQAMPTERHSVADFVKELAVTSGSLKLIAGQVMDIEGEGADLSVDQLRTIHENKTAALLTTSVRFGGMSANADEDQLHALTTFGYSLGLAFQVIDDILDVTQTSEKLGKSAGKDEASDKSTYPAILGLEASRKVAADLTQKAIASLDPFGKEGEMLKKICQYLLDRDY